MIMVENIQINLAARNSDPRNFELFHTHFTYSWESRMAKMNERTNERKKDIKLSLNIYIHTHAHSNHLYIVYTIHIAHRHLFVERVLNKKQNAKRQTKSGKKCQKLKTERNKLKLTGNNELLLKCENAKWVH